MGHNKGLKGAARAVDWAKSHYAMTHRTRRGISVTIPTSWEMIVMKNVVKDKKLAFKIRD